ncbi:TorF family putative porin [Sphingobium sp.]|uniref:TorF family putative porin n=1 Tax=Sphingobium sp. TaxID=1912891 RepID=UPI00260249E2|nr:TorF family putative porin [Sphingobium sp.]
MHRLPAPVAAFVSLLSVAPAFAQDAAMPAPDIAVSGSAMLISDYRFRGISQSDDRMALQGGITLTHKDGAYAGAWASNLSGWGTFGGANMELDLLAGYKRSLTGNLALDVGLTWYMYPGGADKSDFAEPYVKFSGTAGPTSLTAGVAYAPKQEALGRWYRTGADAVSGTYTHPGSRGDNLYIWGDAAVALKGTPLNAKAHIGHSDGNRGLGPNATSVAPTGAYWDWSVGMDAVWRNLTLGVAYVDTDIGRREAAYLQPSFSKGQDGSGSIADGAILLSLSTAF